MTAPRVSIITPCYNAEKYISFLLESVLSQNYSNIELIIVNDGSTDKSLSVIKKYALKLKQKGIHLVAISKNNGGAASAINEALKVFSGDYITFVDADDFLNADSIKERVDFLENNPEYDAVYSHTNVVNESDYDKIVKQLKQKNIHHHNLFLNMLKEDQYIWTQYLVRASFFLKVHPNRKIAEFSAGQNIQLFLPLWFQAKVGYIEKPLVTIVAHPDSHSRSKRSEAEQRTRDKEIESIYIDTLQKIDMPKKEREQYMLMLKEKHKNNIKVYQKIINDKDELGQLYEYDESKFRAHYMADLNSANQSQLLAKLIFSSHSLEKSLSNDNFETGHGLMVAKLLIEMMQQYTKKHYDKANLAYLNTLSVLKTFYERHQKTEYTEKIEQIFNGFLQEIKESDLRIGGSDTMPVSQKKNNATKNFKDLSEGRFAVRTYANKAVDKEDIKEVVQIATKTPTVCNRQSVRVYTMYEKNIIEAVLKAQGGMEYYESPPVLLLVTADDNNYVGPNERNQGFIDGGLFTMSLLYALEYKQLAACPLHAMFNEITEKQIRGMLNIPDNEKLITFIAVGHFNDTNNVCKSFRYPADYILTEKKYLHDFKINTTAPTEENNPQNQESFWSKVRRKIRLRTRIREVKRLIRLRTRVRAWLKKIKIIIQRKKFSDYDGAILTLSGYYNYGNILQRYALQKFLQDNGLAFVSYWNDQSVENRQTKKRVHYTKDFVKRNIICKEFDPKDNFKTYIVGSDQVWRNWSYANVKNDLGYYFFDFLGTRKTKRIAYAASIGQDSLDAALIDQETADYIKPLIKKFDSIALRETSGVSLVKKEWGVNGTQVVDPTLLLDDIIYQKIIDNNPYNIPRYENAVFTYFIVSNEKKRNFVEKIIKEENLTENSIYLEANNILPPVEAWLGGIRDAKLVLTDSFHGVVFSIIFNRPFVVLESGTGGSDRIKTLLEQLGLIDRYIPSNEADSYRSETLYNIDWNSVNKKLKTLKKNSQEWLLDAIKDSTAS